MLKENTYRDTLTHLGIKIAFLMHISAFALVNAGLILVNFQGWTESSILYLLPAWSIGVTLHGITVLLHAANKRQKPSIIEKNQ
jgi:uncharacterized membrane protein